jgi:hypothetical protein
MPASHLSNPSDPHRLSGVLSNAHDCGCWSAFQIIAQQTRNKFLPPIDCLILLTPVSPLDLTSGPDVVSTYCCGYQGREESPIRPFHWGYQAIASVSSCPSAFLSARGAADRAAGGAVESFITGPTFTASANFGPGWNVIYSPGATGSTSGESFILMGTPSLGGSADYTAPGTPTVGQPTDPMSEGQEWGYAGFPP